MYGGAVVLDSASDVVPGTLYNEEVGYADQLLRPDPSTAAIVPWAAATGRMICDTFWDDGRPLGAAPRHVFGRVLERCRALGLEPLIGTEPEFYLLDGETREPLFGGPHIFNTVRNTYIPAVERIVKDMREFGIDIITANAEYAGSQWEIVFGPSSGMAGPDVAFSFKNGVKEIAHQEGLIATFMSKPFGDSAGSGAHNHIGLLRRDSQENAMSDPGSRMGPLEDRAQLRGRTAAPRASDLRRPGADRQLHEAPADAHVQPDQHLLGTRGPQRARPRQGRHGTEQARREPGADGSVEPVPCLGRAAGRRAARDHRRARARAAGGARRRRRMSQSPSSPRRSRSR